jgi:defect in organelle trafficking protein DotA
MRSWWLLLLLLSSQIFAQSVPLSTALSLNPPPSDSSVIFLGNIFGVVDGVLSGTGSQIFGHMMQVFNAAILGLGSIIIMYTLIVGTLNTAQEGEFLGRQWSSVWIPVRCTTGLALLIPKGTGYSLIQIFILWVIVQGVGAGDRIWNAALEYLNMGGKIVQAQQSSTDLISATVSGAQSTNDVLYGASAMLMGQVCMYGLQKILENAQQDYKELANGKNPIGPCAGEIKDESEKLWTKFCTGTIPDFVSTVDFAKKAEIAEAINATNKPGQLTANYDNAKTALDNAAKELASAQKDLRGCWTKSSFNFGTGSIGINQCQKEATNKMNVAAAKISALKAELANASQSIQNSKPQLKMPNFPDDSPFAYLNGLCGTLKWNLMSTDNLNNYQNNFSLGSENMSALKNSRTIALQTMFSNLSSVAYAMVSSNTEFSTSTPQDVAPQFGVALNANGGVCSISDFCQDWGPLPNSSASSQVLFAGNEFVNAIGAYSGLMMPVLNLKYQSEYASFYRKAKRFIDETERTGWIFAGAYFFKLVNLSGSPKQQAYSRDNDSGLGDLKLVDDAFEKLKTNPLDVDSIKSRLVYVNNQYASKSEHQIKALSQLIWGDGSSMTVSSSYTAETGYVKGYEDNNANDENSVLGFIRNSSMLDTGAQPGIKGVKGINVPRSVSVIKPFKMPRPQKGCYGKISIKIIKLKICLFNGFVDALYAFLAAVLNAIALAAYAVLWLITQVLIVTPMLVVIVPMINTAFKVINNMSLSPILDLANLGAYFIQTTLYSYIGMFAVAAIAAFFPVAVIGKMIDIIMAFMMPFYTAWLTYFLGIGFTTTFYVPMIPYIIFIFGAVAWIFLVIEAVLAGPLVALIMTSPEGEGLLGNKGEQGLILLVNLFLRPSLMIIGFITGIALSYVNIWMLNASYSIAADYIRSPPNQMGLDRELARGGRNINRDYRYDNELGKCHKSIYKNKSTISENQQAQSICEERMSDGGDSSGVEAPKEQGVDWDKYPFASLMGMIFYLVLYISMYTTMVQKGFQLIALLPDKVIRWIGGSESAGQETLRWEGEVAGLVKDAGRAAEKAVTGGLQGVTEKTLDTMGAKKLDENEDSSGSAKASGGMPPGGAGGGGMPPGGAAGGGIPPVI